MNASIETRGFGSLVPKLLKGAIKGLKSEAKSKPKLKLKPKPKPLKLTPKIKPKPKPESKPHFKPKPNLDLNSNSKSPPSRWPLSSSTGASLLNDNMIVIPTSSDSGTDGQAALPTSTAESGSASGKLHRASFSSFLPHVASVLRRARVDSGSAYG